MKKTFLSAVLLCVVFLLSAQTEKFDIATYVAPKGWTKTVKNGVVIYSKSDSLTGTYCIIALYAATVSKGTPQKDFNSEWKELAVSLYNADPNPISETQTTTDGWKAVAGAAVTQVDGVNAYIALTVYSGFGKTTSVMVNLNDQAYIADVDQFLGNIRLDKTAKLTGKPVVAPINSNGNNKLVGQWSRSASSPPQYRNGVLVNLVNAGYYKGQYSFKADGTYSFHGEAQTNSDNYRLIDESGQYTIVGKQLTLSPFKGSYRQVKGNGSLVKTEKLSLAKRIYTWQFHYFEGLQENNLVLKANTENLVDGGFSGNAAFPNSFLYAAPPYKLEWKFAF